MDRDANAAVQAGTLNVETVSGTLERVGFGWYQILLVAGVGVFLFAESVEMGAVAPLHTGIAAEFQLNTDQRAALPFFVYGGSLAGMLLAGPLGDSLGRRGTMLLGVVSMILTSLLLAVVPTTTPVPALLMLRVLTGAAGAVGTPAAVALAVESCDNANRISIMFSIMFVSQLGYLAEAFGVALFTPQFGEGPDDDWRGLCLFITGPSLFCLPFVWMLKESPSFLAVTDRNAEAAQSLTHMAAYNGKLDMMPRSVCADASDKVAGRSATLSEKLSVLVTGYSFLIMIFMAIEASRSFFMSGSAYLCKDLFLMPSSQSSPSEFLSQSSLIAGRGTLFDMINQPNTGNDFMVVAKLSPSAMNILASVTPLVGIIIGSRFAFLGVRIVMFCFCMIAAGALMCLTSEEIRITVSSLLLCVLTFKLTYGPIGTCVTLMRAEAFPTEIRATAFASVSTIGKISCMVGPMLIESLKKSERADSWRQGKLRLYLFMLAASAMICGVLGLFVPKHLSEKSQAQDRKDGAELESLDSSSGAPTRNSSTAYGSA